MKDQLILDPVRHLYTLGGKPITGVTTILSMIAKPNLISWAANQAIDYLKDKEPTPEVLKEARTAFAKKRDNASDIGTRVHKWIENWIVDDSIKPDPEIEKITGKFVEWVEKNNVHVFESEKMVYSRKLWYAGTLDLICEYGGKVFLGDIKTSGDIYPEYFFQTAAYERALREMEPDWMIDGHVIINCRKDGSFKVEESYDYKKNIKAFLGALAIYRRKQELDK